MTDRPDTLTVLRAMLAENQRVQAQFPNGDWWQPECTALTEAIAALEAGAGVVDARLAAFFRHHGLGGLEDLPGWAWGYGKDTCDLGEMIASGKLVEHFDEWVKFTPALAAIAGRKS